MDKESLGKRIRKYRAEAGMTAESFAEKLELSTSMIREIERGTRLPSVGTLVKIANTLRVSADSLLCDSIDSAVYVIQGETAEILSGLGAEDAALVRSVAETVAAGLKKRKIAKDGAENEC